MLHKYSAGDENRFQRNS